METTREKIDNFCHSLDSYIINISNNSETTDSNTTISIEVLRKLEIALSNYNTILKELITLENGAHNDKKRLSLSCATVITKQADDDIAQYIKTNWEKDGKPCFDSTSEQEINSLMQGLFKIIRDMELAIRK